MPVIRISHAQVPDQETNERIINAVSIAYAESSGTSIEKLSVILEEIPRGQWGTAGVTLANRDKA